MKFFLSWMLAAIAAMAVLIYGSGLSSAKPQDAPVTDAAADVFSQFYIPLPQGAEKTVIPAEAAEKFDISVYNAKAKAYMDMPLDEYLYGVLLAEMPKEFGGEALKAQAVAARTLVMYKLSASAPAEHKNAPVCTSSGHCMAYISPEDYAAAAGDASYLLRVKEAVDSTSGQILTYLGKPIMAAFHASSYGSTENVSDVWQTDLPYLTSVYTPEAEYPDKVKKLITEKTVTELEFYDAVCSYDKDTALTAAAVKKGIACKKDPAGRVKTVGLGDTEIKASALRTALSLRSTDFTVRAEDGGKLTFTVRGSGHGVGMSQYGAAIMAENGSDYTEILSHYYVGTELSEISR